MAKLAQRLGSATMSLYRHVESKEELQVFMVDAAVGTPPPLEESATDWQAGLLSWARSLMAVYRKHPWILQVTVSGPPMTPAQLAWLEHGLRVQEGLRLEPGEKLNVALAIIGYVRGEAAVAAGMESVTADENAPAQYAKMLAAFIDPDRFPALAELIEDGAFNELADADRPEADTRFEFGLRCLVQGVTTVAGSRKP